tara:strand:- start:296 stop:553 length:258 start_codon:yes stop_codon:yes gene_type:complete
MQKLTKISLSSGKTVQIPANLYTTYLQAQASEYLSGSWDCFVDEIGRQQSALGLTPSELQEFETEFCDFTTSLSEEELESMIQTM